MAQALLSALFLGVLGLCTTVFFGLRGGDISRHILFGFLSTLLTILAHSMLIFYLIGLGKAVKDAIAEHHLTDDSDRRIAAARKPVFSMATIAIVATMVAAIMGAGVDVGVMPPVVHGMIAYGAIASNLMAVKTEIDAIAGSLRIVDEVNARVSA